MDWGFPNTLRGGSAGPALFHVSLVSLVQRESWALLDSLAPTSRLHLHLCAGAVPGGRAL